MDATPIQHIKVVDGDAIIAGRNLKAKLVAAMHVKAGASIDEVMQHYNLSRAEVHAALAYYYDNQDALEHTFREAEAYVREVGVSVDELISRMRARKS